MLYGLYLSATGVAQNSYRQDVIANNLANSETSGFRRQMATFRERPTAARERPGQMSWTDPTAEGVGGGTFAEPTTVDRTPSSFDETGNPLDVAIQGNGYFTVDDHGQRRLTRDGQFIVDKTGAVVLATDHNAALLDDRGAAIHVDGMLVNQTRVARDGTINQAGVPMQRIGVVDVPKDQRLRNVGGTLLTIPDFDAVTASADEVHGGYVERANVDPSTELASLMDAQRQLEANANMIHYQDETLDKLVNSVGKIG